MARYYDMDKLAEMAQAKADTLLPPGNIAFSSVAKWLELLPAADVAPRAEVDFLKKTIAENAQKALEVTLEEVENAKSEVAREIFEEIDREICLALESNYKARDSRLMIVFAHGSSTRDREFIEYVNGKIDTLRGINDFVAELKKKYTEGQK